MFDIITIGTATRDVFLSSPLFNVIKDSRHLKKIGIPSGEAQCFAFGGKIEISKPIFVTGGAAGNTAITFSRQGLKTGVIVKLGRDVAAKEILEEFRREKVVSFAAIGAKAATAYSIILLAPTGGRTILTYRGISEELKISEIPLSKIKTCWIYVSSGKISFETLKKLFDHFAGQKTLIAFNPSGHLIEKMGAQKLKPLLTKSKVVILNKEEAACLTNSDYRSEKEVFRKLDRIAPGIAVMTDGPRGVTVSDGFNLYQAGAFREKKVVDRTGAGDAFGAGFVAGLIQKKEKCEKGFCQIENIEYAIRLGSANATSVVEHIGAKEGILRRSEFERSRRWKRLPIKMTQLR